MGPVEGELTRALENYEDYYGVLRRAQIVNRRSSPIQTVIVLVVLQGSGQLSFNRWFNLECMNGSPMARSHLSLTLGLLSTGGGRLAASPAARAIFLGTSLRTRHLFRRPSPRLGGECARDFGLGNWPISHFTHSLRAQGSAIGLRRIASRLVLGPVASSTVFSASPSLPDMRASSSAARLLPRCSCATSVASALSAGFPGVVFAPGVPPFQKVRISKIFGSRVTPLRL